MQEAYKRILQRRRSQIVEQVPWSRELAAGLERSGLLSKEELRFIEMEFNGSTRMFTALSKVLARDEPGAFERFRRVLYDNGATIMAESLNFDRQRIHWGFERSPKVSSLGEYIDLVNIDLLEASADEAEYDVRRRMVAEARRRLDVLRTTLRQQQLDRDQLRLTLLRASSRHQLTKKQYDEEYNSERLSVSPALVDVSQLRDVDNDKDLTMAASVLSTLTALRRTVGRLRADNRRLRRVVDMSAALGVQLPEEPLSDEPLGDEGSEEDECADNSESQEDSGDEDAEEQFICLRRRDYDSALDTLRSASGGGPGATSTSPVLTASCCQSSVELGQLAQRAADELERWRRRAQQLSADARRSETTDAAERRSARQTDDSGDATRESTPEDNSSAVGGSKIASPRHKSPSTDSSTELSANDIRKAPASSRSAGAGGRALTMRNSDSKLLRSATATVPQRHAKANSIDSSELLTSDRTSSASSTISKQRRRISPPSHVQSGSQTSATRQHAPDRVRKVAVAV